MTTNLPRLIIALATLAILVTSGCYDPAAVCGDHQLLDDEAGTCRCVDDAIRVAGRCQPCHPTEVAVDNACVCPDGEVHDGDGACVEIPAGLGMDCSGAGDCVDPAYPVCHADGYCTAEGCTSSDECGGGYTCADWESPSYCMRPPAGMGESCADQPDCDGYEANICFPVTGECVTELCDVALDDCPVGYFCCDVSALEPSVTTLCIPESVAGLCPASS